MRSFVRLSWLVTLLVVAGLLASCITINPSGLAQSVLTPAVRSDTPAAFMADLVAALVNRDYAQLQSMMGSPFVLALWQSDGQAITPEAGIQRLQDVFVEGASLTFVAPAAVDQWLSGVDPLTLWPAEVKPVSALGISGLGSAGNAQAILIVAEYPDGGFYWYSMLLAPNGFPIDGGSPPSTIIIVNPGQTQPTILPTDVQRVLALGVVGIFTGPGADYSQIGTTSRGQTFPVIGVSPDGQWWAVVCPKTTETCWISANPTFVRPMAPSGPTTATPAPTPYPTPIRPTPTPLPTPIPPDYPTRIPFGPGQDTAVVSGYAGPGQNPQFLFYASAGQQVRLLLESAGGVANFSLRGVGDGQWYKSINNPSREWSVTLPRSQDYLITVASPVHAYFTLEVTLLGSRPPTATPVPVYPERISFAPGQESAVRSGPLYANTPKSYVFAGAAGQTATILLGSPSPAANFSVVGVDDGIPYKTLGNAAREWSFELPRTQDYLITLLAPVNTSYTLELIISRPGPTPTPAPERISFEPGESTAVRTGVLYNGNAKQYVFLAQAGQTATILLSGPLGSSANFSVRGMSDGVTYKSASDPARESTFYLPRTQDYLITITAPGETAYTLELTIPPLGPTAVPPTVVPPTVVPPTVVPPTVVPPTVVPPTVVPPTVVPPTVVPPTVVPPTVVPPTVVPPTVVPPTVVPPTVVPPTVVPPTVVPPTVVPPTVVPPTVVPPTVVPPTAVPPTVVPLTPEPLPPDTVVPSEPPAGP